MTSRRAGPELQALLPWLAAGFLWFAVLPPLRSGEADRLSEQSAIRRDKVRAERALREALDIRTRMGAAFAGLCRASSDPAALRQRAVAATSGLPLSPLSLSVMGGGGGGASIEAAGARRAILILVERLGDPARGGFLRTVSLREKGALSLVSATTGVFDTLPPGLPAPSAVPSCGDDPDLPPGPAAAEAPKAHRPASIGSRAPSPGLSGAPQTQPAIEVLPDASAPPPFSLIAFVSSAGKTRVSLRAGDEVRFVGAGEQIAGWRCLRIDRDAGAEFVSPAGERVVLRALR